jgi:predicted enzyme related to lactoylglutathione lyase
LTERAGAIYVDGTFSTLTGFYMQRVTGIGGIFIKARNPQVLREWYQKHLGIDVQAWGGTAFAWADGDGKPVAGMTIWSVGDGENFKPGTAPFMVNYRVADVSALVAVLKDEGCEVLGDVEDSEYGKFAWVLDAEGNKVELWQPPPGQ